MELKMGRCYMDGAYEIAEILATGGLLERWMDEGEEYPHTLNHTLACWYLAQPQPAAEDIVGVVNLEKKGQWYSLTFKIRRGKEMLAAFYNQHEYVLDNRLDDGIFLRCEDCKKSVYLPWDSFGHLGGELVRQAVAPASDAPENKCTGAVQRIDYSDTRGLVSQPGDRRVDADSSQ
jgi:hypothetical protein